MTKSIFKPWNYEYLNLDLDPLKCFSNESLCECLLLNVASGDDMSI